MPVISRDVVKNNNSINILSLFLFFFFLACTVGIVVASIFILRRIKKRERNTNKEDDGGLSIVVARANGTEHGANTDKESGLDSNNSSTESLGLVAVPPNAHVRPRPREMV